MKKGTRYSTEYRERAIRLLFERRNQHSSQWAATENQRWL